MKTQPVSSAEQKASDADETLRNIDRRFLNAQLAIAIFPLFLGAMIALYSLGDSAIFAVAVGFGSILMAAIGMTASSLPHYVKNILSGLEGSISGSCFGLNRSMQHMRQIVLPANVCFAVFQQTKLA